MSHATIPHLASPHLAAARARYLMTRVCFPVHAVAERARLGVLLLTLPSPPVTSPFALFTPACLLCKPRLPVPAVVCGGAPITVPCRSFVRSSPLALCPGVGA